MRILGVDPGTFRTGAGLIESQGSRYRLIHWEIITPKSTLSLNQRLHQIYLSLCQIISQHHPDVLALENVFYSKNPRSMIKIGEARACAILAASEQGVNVVEYAPARIKQ